MARPARGIRVLLCEGSSTSARQAITALGLAGYELEICDPDPHCLGRFSKFVKKFHRCPGLGVDPQGYLDFMLDLLARRRFDVLLPIHEQGLLFAKVRRRLEPLVAVALPEFDIYASAHSKASFSRLLGELELPQPATTFVAGEEELLALARTRIRFPLVVKMAIGTASRGVWIIHDRSELRQAVNELAQCNAFADVVLVQDFVAGAVEHAQAVFCRGRLVGLHGYVQLMRGAGGGDAMKASIHRATVRADLAKLGARLEWHGALSVDYIVPDAEHSILYIDCNPRLVEPMNALLSGCDLADLLVRVSLGEMPAPVPDGRDGTRTHMAIQVLLGCATRGGSRRDVLRECLWLAAGRGPYAGSCEELTPLRDWPSVAANIVVALALLANPNAAHTLPKRFGPHLLDPAAVRTIRERIKA